MSYADKSIESKLDLVRVNHSLPKKKKKTHTHFIRFLLARLKKTVAIVFIAADF